MINIDKVETWVNKTTELNFELLFLNSELLKYFFVLTTKEILSIKELFVHYQKDVPKEEIRTDPTLVKLRGIAQQLGDTRHKINIAILKAVQREKEKEKPCKNAIDQNKPLKPENYVAVSKAAYKIFLP